MKTQYKLIRVLAIAFSVLLVVLSIESCEDEDFKVIPDAEIEQTIFSIAPARADVGATVLIKGTDFSPVPVNNKVSFNEVSATVTAATDTLLTVTVPEGATTGPISVSKAKFTIEGPVFTVFPAPSISELSVTGAAVGETITIKGLNFGATVEENIVRFNSIEAEIVNASATELEVKIPAGATTGPLTIEVQEQTATLEIFTITPVILSFEPIKGVAGEEITLMGTNFSRVAVNNNVTFNGVLAEVVSASTTSLTVIVPPEANSGKIAVEIEQLLALSETDFATVPTIASFSPETAAPESEVIINGANFSPILDENIVRFNGTVAEVTESAETSLTVLVPDGSEIGPITVEVDGEVGASTIDFIVDNSIVTITIAINNENDDVEEAEDGRMLLTSGDLELGEFDTFTDGGDPVGLQKIGLRFNNVDIPDGVTIESASIIFVADQTEGADPTEMTIFGENIGNAVAYTEDINNLSNRPLTTANAVWNIPEWIGSDTPIEDTTTVDISTIISEIIARVDWAQGNSMNFIFEATGVSAGAIQNDVGREAETYDADNPEEGAQLIITYRIN
ncbi:IPT/TIG domain-containing protein [Flagellimonas sp. 389]|uniref:IPT/TIG domain-containing protein n=1 Tax=Flagellimonas sp. 389 TaxID=2835862 RepID=UPI001BD2F0D4|nr:IPT/TIG domain-containing protein [Flagellimonas sp. 389]MBS9463926.1 IPT/TIG domain-containing protein [Flagellimonas sp. 389]